jgi:hypothetical protein
VLPRPALRLALLLVLLVGLLAPAGPARSRERHSRPGSPSLATPQLLDRAVARGRLDRDTADLYLAYAIGAPERLPRAYASPVTWDGTLPLLHLRERLAAMPPGPERRAMRSVIGTAADPGTCSDSLSSLPDSKQSTYFYVEYDSTSIGGGSGLDLNDYTTSLDAAWTAEVVTYGWAAPPVAPVAAPGSKYHVRIEDLSGGLYGFVDIVGTHAGPVGNNPTTAWNDVDAFASCMVVNEDFSGFPSSPQDSLDSTTAHEFNHSIQFGYGALTGPNAPDDVFVEGGATWMEDEVFDDADDNYNYLWPTFTESMGAYEATLPFTQQFPYPYWVVFRGLTERYGSGTAGGAEDVMQAFWEGTSQSAGSNQFPAMNAALAARGTTLSDAFHAFAVAVRLGQTCGGAWVHPYCLEEAAGYAAAAGPVPTQGTIGSPGGELLGTVRDDHAINWVTMPASGPYPVTLYNTSTGGVLRATMACPTASGPKLAPLPALVGPGGSTTLVSFDPAGCGSAPVAVITNDAESSANPVVSTPRSYRLAAAPAEKVVILKARPKKLEAGERTRLKATVSPCAGHEGDVVEFYRGATRIAAKASNASCVASKRVRLRRTSSFKAISPQQDADHGAGTSNKVKVRVLPA